MLVVIGIIAVLAAIIVPVYGKIQERADKVKCAAHLQQIGIAQTMYRNDKKRHAASLFEVAAGGYLTNKDEAGCPADQETPSVLPTGPADPPGTPPKWMVLNGKRVLAQSSYEWVDYMGDDRTTWNYWGYGTDGMEIDLTSPPATWPSKRLYDRNCPGTTVVTHCPFHRESTLSAPTGDDLDNVLLKDGSVKSDVKAAPYDWVTQP